MMQLLSALASVALVSAAAIPDTLVEGRAVCTLANPAALVRARNAFYNVKLVPDLIPEFNPTLDVAASYPSEQVDLGNTFNTLRERSASLVD
jgi:hypothetical protein